MFLLPVLLSLASGFVSECNRMELPHVMKQVDLGKAHLHPSGLGTIDAATETRIASGKCARDVIGLFGPGVDAFYGNTIPGETTQARLGKVCLIMTFEDAILNYYRFRSSWSPSVAHLSAPNYGMSYSELEFGLQFIESFYAENQFNVTIQRGVLDDPTSYFSMRISAWMRDDGMDIMKRAACIQTMKKFLDKFNEVRNLKM